MVTPRAAFSATGDRVTVRGVLDVDSVPALALATAGLFPGRQRIAIDLAAVEQGDSAGIALLLDWCRRARAAGCELTLLHLPDSLRGIAQVCGAWSLLPVASDD